MKVIRSSIKWVICDNDYIDNDVKVRDITAKCRASAHRDCNISVKKNYDQHLILQELGKFNLKTIVIPNGLEKDMRFTISNKLIFVHSL